MRHNISNQLPPSVETIIYFLRRPYQGKMDLVPPLTEHV